VPDRDALTVYVVRRNWGDGRNFVKVYPDGGAGVDTLPDTMVRFKFKPGAHSVAFEFDGKRQSTTVRGQAGEVRFVRIDGVVWAWKSTYEWVDRARDRDPRARAQGTARGRRVGSLNQGDTGSSDFARDLSSCPPTSPLRHGVRPALLPRRSSAPVRRWPRHCMTGVGPWMLAGLLYLGSGLGWRCCGWCGARHRRASSGVSGPGWRCAVLTGGVVGSVLLMFGLDGHASLWRLAPAQRRGRVHRRCWPGSPSRRWAEAPPTAPP
jgi:hypothetical protein